MLAGGDKDDDDDSTEKEELHQESNLFSIIKTTEFLERAYVGSTISDSEYEQLSLSLIAQFKTVERALKQKFPDIKEFMRTYDMKCPLAVDRLLVAGVPATKLFGTDQQKSSKESLLTFELSERCITLLDALRLKERSVDVIQPLVQEVISHFNQMHRLPQDTKGVDKVRMWGALMSEMRAHDAMTEDQARQLILDTELAYGSFKSWLQYQ